MQNYYEVLEIPENATGDEIKKAHRRLANIHHPDKNNGSKESEEKFKKIQEAYEALSDKDERLRHDMGLAEERRQESIRREKQREAANNRNSGPRFTGHRTDQKFDWGPIIIMAVIVLVTTLIVAAASSNSKISPPPVS